MAIHHINQMNEGKTELKCENTNGIAVVDNSGLLMLGQTIKIDFQNCFDRYLNDRLGGNYSLKILDISDNQQQLSFEINLTSLSIIDIEGDIRLQGTLIVNLSQSLKNTTIEIAGSETNHFSILFPDLLTEVTATSLSLTKILNYASARYEIFGAMSVDSNLIGFAFNANYQQPFSGYLNEFPDSGKLFIDSPKSNLQLIVSDNQSGYTMEVDLGDNGTFETPPDNAIVSWWELVEGGLFYDERTAPEGSPTTSITQDHRPFKLVELSGYISRESSEYVINRNADLIFIFSRPIEQPIAEQPQFLKVFTSLGIPDYEIDGAILTIRPGALLDELSYYTLTFKVNSSSGESVSIGSGIKTIKPIVAEIKGVAFGYENTELQLDAASLSLTLADSILTYQWLQTSGPSLNFSSDQPIINLLLPGITSDYQEVVFNVIITDTDGEQDETEFSFLIVKESLNRNLIYIPDMQNGYDKVLQVKQADSFLVETDNSLIFEYDYSYSGQTSYPLSTAFMEEKFPIGDFVSDTESHGGIDLRSPIGKQQQCDFSSHLGPLSESRYSRFISLDLQRDLDTNSINKANLLSNHYCKNTGRLQTDFGVLIQPDIFSIETPGFIFANQTGPLWIQDDIEVEITTSNTNILSVVNGSPPTMQAANVVENSVEKISVTNKAGNGKRTEIFNIDVIASLDDKAFVYFEKQIYRFDKSRPYIMHRFHRFGNSDDLSFTHSSSVSLVDLAVGRSEGDDTFSVNIGFPGTDSRLNERITTSSNGSSDGNYMSTSYDGTGCVNDGWYELLDYVKNADGSIEKLALDFFQNCGGKQFNRGAIRYNTTIGVDFSKFTSD